MQTLTADDLKSVDDWSYERIAEAKDQCRQKNIDLIAKGEGRPFLIAEGDSWFNYSVLGMDIMDWLVGKYFYPRQNFAVPGDTLENMIYGTAINNFEPLPSPLDSVLRAITNHNAKILLFSGGGNDVVGDKFGTYLNHKHSGAATMVRESVVTYMIDDVFRQCFEHLIRRVHDVSPQTHIIVHGYGHTLPTGKGADVMGWIGPWLKPALARKRIVDPGEQRTIVFSLIDRFNDLLADLDHQHEQFHHVDLRRLIDPQHDWVNELHLTSSAYERVADEIHKVIETYT